ncbi:Cell division cycle protein-like protein [Melia azedarach]|uniref:Cell division cycle protein-like protein n=1 Tax=Melia azedarach TaxID=155640 RepID=A0ACC1Y2Q1_MELAZ|nr:Cell division cycle protein-like protein [Melia azedarach]
MAGKNPSSLLLTFFIFAMVLSPTLMLPCEAARFSANGLSGVMRLQKEANYPQKVYCPHCVCCAPAPPGKCCKCGC